MFIKISLAVVTSLLFSACEDDPKNTNNNNDQELITTVTLQLVSETDTVKATFKDLDGSGGNNPTIETLLLKANKTYKGSISLFDESKNPVLNIAEEVKEEGNVHQLFYEAKGSVAGKITVSNFDKDANNLPLGLTFDLATSNETATVSGFFNVILSHYDGTAKNGTDKSNETDVDIDFPVTVSP